MSNFNASDNTGFSSSYLTNITEVTNESSIRRGGSNGHGVGGTYADDDSAVSSEVTIDEPPAAANRSRSRTQSIESTMEEPEEAVQLTRALETDTNSQANNDNNNNAINTMEQERAGILPRNRREWCIVLFAVFMIVAVATGVGLGLGLFMSNRNGTDTSTQNNRDVPSLGDTDTAGKSNPSRAPTSNGPTASSSPTTMSLMGDYDGDSFSDAIEYHLIAQEISSIASFRDVAGESEMEDGELTAQQQARDFLVFNDFLPLGLDDEDDDTEEEVNGKTRRIKSGTPYLKASHPAYRVVQRFVAATLYFSTNGTQWFDSNTWVEPGVHECEWLGITCEEISIPSVSLLEVLENPEKLPTNKNGRIDTTTERMITEINLPENNLGGYLPQEIMALPYLQMLGLWSNMIGGALPTQLGNLAKLQTVHLEDNEFTGSIPTEIGLWAEIKDLALSRNEGIDGTIPTEIGNLVNIERLWLSDMLLRGSIPTEIGNLEMLTDLNLKSNNLDRSLPDEIKDLVNLESLYLTSNSFTEMIPQSWSSLVNLKHFEVGDNKLRGEIPDFFAEFPNLETACFHQNRFAGKIPSSIGYSGDSMKKITLFENKFGGNIPDSIKDCTNIERLEMGSNQIRGDIPEWIGDLENLVYLDLSDNQFSGSVPSQLSKLSNLRELRLAKNSLVGTVPCGFLDAITFGSADCENSDTVTCKCCTLCL